MAHISQASRRPTWRRWLDRLLGRSPVLPSHLLSGEWGEDMACHELKKTGMTVIGRRVRIGRRDELDILARDGEVLVFIEVKTRRDISFGRPGAAVGADKRRNLSRAAMRYMKSLKTRPARFRFDIVEIIGSPDEGVKDVKHIRNAFTLKRPLHVPW